MEMNFKYSLEKDLGTYLRLLDKNKEEYDYGRKNVNKERLKNLPEKLQKIIQTTDKEDIEKAIKEYLEETYNKNKDFINKNITYLNNSWKDVGDQIIFSLENFYGKRFPFEEISVYLTKNVYYSYNVEQRYFFAPFAHTIVQLEIIKHELNHFMFHHYYETALSNELDKSQFQLLKESLTFFTNPSEKGYPAEKELRDLYKSKYWNSFDEILDTALKLLKQK